MLVLRYNLNRISISRTHTVNGILSIRVMPEQAVLMVVPWVPKSLSKIKLK